MKKKDAQIKNKSRKVTQPKRNLRIYSDGIFDIFHFGHMRMLEQVRNKFPNATLIVGVCSDKETHLHKGITVMTMEERAESVRHCRWVDEIIKDAPWVITKKFLEDNSIDFVAHDSIPYASEDTPDTYKEVKDLGLFIETERTEGISTSEIISRILRKYRLFLYRNIVRGASCKDLNITRFTLYSIVLSESIRTQIEVVRKRVGNIKIRDRLIGIAEVCREATAQARDKISLLLG